MSALTTDVMTTAVTSMSEARALRASETEDGGLRSVSIAVAVLDCFREEEELGATQVARRLGVAKSTASRMLSALALGGLLERTPVGRYRLGMRLFEYGQLAMDRLPLRTVARPILMQLQGSLQEMVQLGVPVSGHVLFVDRFVSGAMGQRLSGDVLRRVPGYSSSAGRAMAAFDPAVARATLAVERSKRTAFTVTETDRLEDVLAATRRAGWVGSREEYELGYASIAAPVIVRGNDGPRVVAAVTVVGSTPHILGLRKEFIVRSVCRAVRQIATELASAGEA